MKLHFGRSPLAIALWITVPIGAVQAQAPAYEGAQSDYAIGHFQRAFTVFAALADEGHCDAARMAHEMLRFGPLLYAQRFDVPPDRAARWRAVAPCPEQETQRTLERVAKP